MTKLSPQQERFAMNIYYVYVYRIDREMVYVGKGKGGRSHDHLRKSHNPILEQRILAGSSVKVKIIKRGLSEPEAFRLERRCINKWQKTLTNMTQGTRTRPEAIWYRCLSDLQNRIVSYGAAITKPSRSLYRLGSREMAGKDDYVLRIQNVAWLKRQIREIMREVESECPGLVS